MGNRKAKKRQVKRVADKLPTSFDCPFCSHSGSVDCRMNRNENTARIVCRVCESTYEMVINSLSEPVDVYCAWIDACENVNIKENGGP